LNVHAGTRNERHHSGVEYEVAQLSAAGFQWPPGLARDPVACLRTQPRFNGGIVSAIEVRLQKDDILYRFADSSADASGRLAGCWWFDSDTFLFLKNRAAQSGRQIRDMAREAFAVHDAFDTDMGIMLQGRLASAFWAFKGVTATADNKNPKNAHQPFGQYAGGGDDFRAPAPSVMTNRFGFDAMQLYVPGGFGPGDFSPMKEFDRL
jgi:hypothetical protein